MVKILHHFGPMVEAIVCCRNYVVESHPYPLESFDQCLRADFANITTRTSKLFHPIINPGRIRCPRSKQWFQPLFLRWCERISSIHSRDLPNGPRDLLNGPRDPPNGPRDFHLDLGIIRFC